jgi:hypothetical protein
MIHLLKFSVGLDVNSGVLWLAGNWEYINGTRDIGKEFSIVAVLPFTIEAYNYVPYYWPKIESWKAINTNVRGVVASAVSIGFSGNLTKYSVGYFYGEFIVAKTYASSHRGSYTIVLPLDRGIDGPYFPGLISFAWGSGVSCCTLADEVGVYLTLPMSAVAIEPFPPARVGFFNRLSDNMTLKSVEWDLTQVTQVTLSYVDETEQSTYEGSIIMGSLLLGGGISGIGDWLKDLSTPNRPYLRKSTLHYLRIRAHNNKPLRLYDKVVTKLNYQIATGI